MKIHQTSKFKVTGKTYIRVVGNGNDSDDGYYSTAGIFVDNSSANPATFDGEVNIKVADLPTVTSQNGVSYGVLLLRGVVEFKKGLPIDITEAGNRSVAILSASADGPVTIQGGTMIVATEDQTALDGNIKILSDTNTVNQVTGKITGSVVAEFSGDQSFYTGQAIGNSAKLSFSNNATWNVRGESSVFDLTLDNASLIFDQKDASLTVSNSSTITGTNTVYVSGIAEGGQYLTLRGSTQISEFKVVAAGTFNDNQSDLNSNVNELVKSIAGEDNAKMMKTVTLAEGQLYGETTLSRNESGGYTVTSQKANTKLEAIQNVRTLSAMKWRHEVNDLNERMGQLRDSPSGIGAWARVYGSEMEYGSPKVTAKNKTLQIGSDVSVGNWTIGLAGNYTDGESEYDGGYADTKNYGIALYGSWFGDSGAYVDLIAKYSRMENDFTVKELSGSSDTNAVSFSAETGYRFGFVQDSVFVEPQVELSYGHVGGDSFKTGYIEVKQESYYSLMGRVGVRAGFTFPNKKGTIFAKASVVHDFGGEIESTVTNLNSPNNSVHMKEDIGDTSFEYGIGANFSWTDNTYTYLSLERSAGGDVNEKYRFNVGLRYVF